jgi:hypothetical protein
LFNIVLCQSLFLVSLLPLPKCASTQALDDKETAKAPQTIMPAIAASGKGMIIYELVDGMVQQDEGS